MFTFYSSAINQPGGHFKEKSDLALADQQIMVDDKGSSFQAQFPDVFAGYENPPLTGNVAMSNKAYHAWISTPFVWYQNQLNFAVWCATAGCGVSAWDHLSALDPLIASLYCFHTLYQIRRILEKMHIAMSGEIAHSWY
ncbi:MAG: hypothetical protein AB2693_24285 [Candidatus Thiodiazotropha sp.]